MASLCGFSFFLCESTLLLFVCPELFKIFDQPVMSSCFTIVLSFHFVLNFVSAISVELGKGGEERDRRKVNTFIQCAALNWN